MMFLSFARNSSCVPLSCGLGLSFILAPQNKIARFQHSPYRNLAISPNKNQQKSTVKTRVYSIFNAGLFWSCHIALNAASRSRGASRDNPNRSSTSGRTTSSNLVHASSGVLARISPPMPPMSTCFPALAARWRRSDFAWSRRPSGETLFQRLHHVNYGRCFSSLGRDRNGFSLELGFNQFIQALLEFILESL